MSAVSWLARWGTTNRGSTTNRKRCCGRSWTPPGQEPNSGRASRSSGSRLKGQWRTPSRTTTLFRSPMATFGHRREGRAALRAIAALGLDPVPDYQPPAEFVAGLAPDEAGQPPLVLITGAAHHFVTTSMANQPGLVAKEGTPFIEINPEDAAARRLVHGEDVIVSTSGAGARCAPSSPTTCPPVWPFPLRGAGPHSLRTVATSIGSPRTPSPTSRAKAPFTRIWYMSVPRLQWAPKPFRTNC